MSTGTKGQIIPRCLLDLVNHGFMIHLMKNHRAQIRQMLAAAAVMMMVAAPQVMAQVKNPDPGQPRLGDEATQGSWLIWTLAGAFTALVLLVAFRNAKRIIGNRD